MEDHQGAPHAADSQRPRLDCFVRLARATTIATYLLILVGALVRASGAGLGCPDWPRCYGSWIPPFSVAQLPAGFDPAAFNPVLTWMEYVNRLLGVSIGLLIVATFVVAVLWVRGQPRIFWPSLTALLLVGFQGWLGGQVVRSGLVPWIITAHMVFALIIVTLLLYATYHAAVLRAGDRGLAPSRARRKLAAVMAVVILLVLVQVGLGTQVRAGMEHAVDLDPGLPRSEWLAQVPVIDGIHRGFSQVVLFAVLAIGFWVQRRFAHDAVLLHSTRAAIVLVFVQLALGLGLASLGVPPWAQVLHLSGASLLLGALVLGYLQTQREPGAMTEEYASASPPADPLQSIP
jgi:heme a synthase